MCAANSSSSVRIFAPFAYTRVMPLVRSNQLIGHGVS
jgi:hypothetical protein